MSEYWDEAYRSGEYRKRWDYHAASPEVVACVAVGLLPRGGVTLDAGCGSGSDAVFLATQGFRVKALDISPTALELVKAKADRAKVEVERIHGSATKMPIEDGSVDFALDRGLLHNLGDGDGRAYASELARVMKTGAGFLLRGARIDYDGTFNPITPERIERTFPNELFTSGPVVPITMLSDAEAEPTLDGAIVIIRRI